MLRIITLNLNGIRSAASKGVLDWLAAQKADVVCLQEVKAQLPDLAPALLNPSPYTGHFSCAEKKGYSGVGLYCRKEPDKITAGFGSKEFDAEGRYLRADYGKLSVISVYQPSGSSSDERQQAKFRFMRAFMPHLARLKAEGREIVLCGDWNIAHKEIDLKNWKGNLKNSGFLPEERAWMSHVLDDLGYVDVFRALNPNPDQYTWWSNRGQARAKNVGWRIDYHLATPGVAALAQRGSEAIYTAERFSDHAPLSIDYALPF